MSDAPTQPARCPACGKRLRPPANGATAVWCLACGQRVQPTFEGDPVDQGDPIDQGDLVEQGVESDAQQAAAYDVPAPGGGGPEGPTPQASPWARPGQASEVEPSQSAQAAIDRQAWSPADPWLNPQLGRSGTPFTLPATPPTTPFGELSPAATVSTPYDAMPGLRTEPLDWPPPDLPRDPVKPLASPGHPLVWSLLGIATAALLLIAALAATGQVDWFKPWEERALPRAVALRSEAQALAARGEIGAAFDKYAEIDRLPAGRPMHSQPLADVMEASAAERDRLSERVRRERQGANPATETAGTSTLPAANDLSASAAPPGPQGSTGVASAAPGTDVPASTVASSASQQANVQPPAEIAGGNPTKGDGAAPGGGIVTRPDLEATPTDPPPSDRSGVAQASPPAGGDGPLTSPTVPSVAAGDKDRVIDFPPPRQRPAVAPLRPTRAELSDEEIGTAIQKGVEYLLSNFNAKHVVRDEDAQGPSWLCGEDALVVYALLQAGQAIDDPRVNKNSADMRAKLDALKQLPIDGHHQTYARGLRSTCLALFNRPEDFKTLQEDVDWLLGTTNGGAYTYNGNFIPIGRRGNFGYRNGPWDNSNSQYGLLGVWSGADADPRIEVPLSYWRAVARHWTTCQNTDGEWGYREANSSARLTMTCAGIASMFVAHEYIEPPLTNSTVGRDPYPAALAKALDWFEQGNNALKVDEGVWWGYGLYGIERVGLASGFKQFGQHDWYRELSARIVSRQLANGSWGDGLLDTSYAVLFLSRGRHPIFMNKLRFDGAWANRPRDVANVTRFASRQMERPLNWQIVNVKNDWTDWTDSPILYIASHDAPKLTEEQIGKLRSFALAGGLIFTHADANRPATADKPGFDKFDVWARNLANRLFPPYELQRVPENHPIWTSVYRLTVRPELWGVSNGSRLLLVHSPTDISLSWQQRADRPYESVPVDTKRPALASPAVLTPENDRRVKALSSFHFGVNLFVYAAGKRELRNRLALSWITPPDERPVDTVRVARLRYAGNWDPEPVAWTRYGVWFFQQTGTRLQTDPVKLADLTRESAQNWPVAHLTGTAAVGFSDRDVAGLRSYVEGGGVVLIDSTGGLNAFDADVREHLLPRAFPGAIPRVVLGDHPLVQAGRPGMQNIGKTLVRSYVLETLGGGTATIQLLDGPGRPKDPAAGAGAVVLSSMDVTSGLLGTNTWGILGLDPRYAQALVKNVIFWSLDGRPRP